MYPKRLFGDKLLVNSLNVFVIKIVSTNVAENSVLMTPRIPATRVENFSLRNWTNSRKPREPASGASWWLRLNDPCSRWCGIMSNYLDLLFAGPPTLNPVAFSHGRLTTWAISNPGRMTVVSSSELCRLLFSAFCLFCLVLAARVRL